MQSGVFQGLFGDKNLGRFATKKVAIFEFLEKGWKSGDFGIEIGEKWLFQIFQKWLQNGDFWVSWKVVEKWWFGDRNWLKCPCYLLRRCDSQIKSVRSKVSHQKCQINKIIVVNLFIGEIAADIVYIIYWMQKCHINKCHINKIIVVNFLLGKLHQIYTKWTW